jgi:hypothetical protein
VKTDPANPRRAGAAEESAAQDKEAANSESLSTASYDYFSLSFVIAVSDNRESPTPLSCILVEGTE